MGGDGRSQPFSKHLLTAKYVQSIWDLVIGAARGIKKKRNTCSCLGDEGDRNTRTVRLFDPRSRHFNPVFQRCLYEEQKPATWDMCKHFSSSRVYVRVCRDEHVCMDKHVWERDREGGEEMYIGIGMELGWTKNHVFCGRSFLDMLSQSSSDPTHFGVVFCDPNSNPPSSLSLSLF